MISIDDDGKGLNYPSYVYFDSTEEEIYLINGGTSRIVVYGPDFFPRVSIGRGRNVGYPRGVYVTKNGQVYISQAVNKNNPVRRITILNGAFFVDREIFLDEIPEAAGLAPSALAVSRQGTIYLTSERIRGVMVLDQDGNFLRWLKPMDMISDRKAVAEAEKALEEAEKQSEEELGPIEVETQERSPTEEDFGDIPEEFRPRGKDDDEAPAGPGLGPVKISHITIDNAGNIYLLSTEMSKVYVYDPEETFLFSFGQKGGTPRTMSQPRSLAIDEENGIIYVVDYTRHTIIAYDTAGAFLFEIGGRGFKPGYFNFPTSIAVNRHGQVIVADLFNKRVQVLDIDSSQYFPVFGEKSSGGADSGVEGQIEEGGAKTEASQEGLEGEDITPAEDSSVQLPADGESQTPEGSAPPAMETGGAQDEGRPEATSAPDDAEIEEVVIPEEKLPAQTGGKTD